MHFSKRGLFALCSVALFTSISNASFDPVSRITQILQRAQTLSINCLVKSGTDPSYKQLIELKKPNLLKISVGAQFILANGDFIETTDEVGKMRSRVKQTTESFRALLQEPALRLWSVFFDGSSFKNCSIKPLETVVADGKLCDSIQVEWINAPVGGFKALFDAQSGLPREVTGFSASSRTSTRVSVKKLDIDPSLGAEVFGTNTKSEVKGESGENFSVDWSKCATKKSIQLFPKKGIVEFSGDVSTTRSMLRASTPSIKLTLTVDGQKHSEINFDEHEKIWKLILNFTLIPEGEHTIAIQAEYDGTNFVRSKTSLGTIRAKTVSEIALPIASLTQKIDGTLSVRLVTPPEIEGNLILNVSGRAAPATLLTQEMSVVLDNLEPGKQIVTGTLITENGFNLPVIPATVDVPFMYAVRLADAAPIQITADKPEGFLTVNFGSAANLGKVSVEISNSTVHIGNVLFENGTVKVDFAALIDGNNYLVFRHALPNGKIIVLGTVEFTASIDIEVQRRRTVQRLFAVMFPNIHLGVSAFRCAASGSKPPEELLRVFDQVGKRIPTTHDWSTADSWQPNSRNISRTRPPLTTDAKFNEVYVESFKMGLLCLDSLRDACYQMSLAMGQDGVIKRTNPEELSKVFLTMVSEINLADSSAKSAQSQLATFMNFFETYSKESAIRFKDDVSTLAVHSQLWNSHSEHVAFLRTISAMVNAVPSEIQLMKLLNSMGQATNTDWRTATKVALQKLGSAYQDIRKLNDLNDKLKAEKSTNRRKEIIAQITSLKAKIVAGQIEAWELIRNAGQKLGIVLDGIYDAAPKITPDF